LNPGKLLVNGTPKNPWKLVDMYSGRGYSEPLPYRPIKKTDDSLEWDEKAWDDYRTRYSLENLKKMEGNK
jgi:hypothetical protein